LALGISLVNEFNFLPLTVPKPNPATVFNFFVVVLTSSLRKFILLKTYNPHPEQTLLMTEY
ncbi:TPA: hypothetical protein ACNSDR_002975, partial [Staphylococcus aureus]